MDAQIANTTEVYVLYNKVSMTFLNNGSLAVSPGEKISKETTYLPHAKVFTNRALADATAVDLGMDWEMITLHGGDTLSLTDMKKAIISLIMDADMETMQKISQNMDRLRDVVIPWTAVQEDLHPPVEFARPFMLKKPIEVAKWGEIPANVLLEPWFRKSLDHRRSTDMAMLEAQAGDTIK